MIRSFSYQTMTAFINSKKRPILQFGSVLFLMLGTFFSAQASHIVGGEMNYTCLGGDQYEITLTIYRDCFYADPLAVFDPEASVGVFGKITDDQYTLIDDIRLLVMPDDTLTPILSDSCLFVPDDVCVHTTTYRDTVELPYRTGGYSLVYQRCCRNGTINNIIDPANAGATYTIELTEEALNECNTGAKFNDWPPIFVCVNEPIYWDHSAFDSDGDSLVYSLCAPLQGEFNVNKPQPPMAPPYNTVSWAAPYNLDNVLGGIPLEIDPHTGIITGTPTTIGQFVVGICVTEYRNGEAISMQRRDFQYNIGQCLEVIAGIGNDTIQCGDLTVDFINTSITADDFEWHFGDPANPSFVSTEENPTYTYADTGHFSVMLIAEPSDECADTAFLDLWIKYSSLEADFDYLVLDCVDSFAVSTTNNSIDSVSNIESYLWELSDGQTSTSFEPDFFIEQTNEYDLTLTVTADDGCVEVTEENFFANVLTVDVILDTFVICPGASVSINPEQFRRSNVTYEWMPAETLNNPNSSNPIATPTETTLYQVIITDTLINCTGGFSVLVELQENGGEILMNDTTFCSENFIIEADSTNLTNMQWSTDPDFGTILGTETALMVDHAGEELFYLSVTDELGCSFTDSIQVTGGAVQVTIEAPDTTCLGEPFTLTSNNDDPVDVISYLWSPNDAVVSPNAPSTSAILEEEGMSSFTLSYGNQFGCNGIASVDVFVYTTDSPTSFQAERNCDGNTFAFNNNHTNNAIYQWDFGDGSSSSTGESVTHSYDQAGTYTVTLYPIEGLPCTLDTLRMEVVVPEVVLTPDFEYEVASCGDEVMIELTDLSQSLQGEIVAWQWDFGNGQGSDRQNPSFTSTNPSTLTINLTITTDEGCEESFAQSFDPATYFMDVSFMDLNPNRCGVSDVALNPNGNPNFTYQWSPVETLDDPNAINPISSALEDVTYQVTITDEAAGCQVERTVDLRIASNLLNADFEWLYEDCVEIAQVNFQSLATSSAGIASFDWEFSSGFTQDQESFSTIINGEQALDVTFTVTGNDGCVESQTRTLNVMLLDLDLQPNQFICNGESVELNSGGNDAYTYSWSPATALSDANAAMPIANPTESTEYTVTVLDPNTNCQVEQTVMIEVPDELNAAIDLSYDACEGPAVVNFTDESTYNSNIVEWEWNFSNGSTSAEANPQLTLSESTDLEVEFIATADDGCTDTLTQLIPINIISFQVDMEDITVCNAIPTDLNPNADPNLTYSWFPTNGLDNPSVPNPLANPTSTTTYTVTISDPANGGCEVTQEVTAEVPNYEVDLDFEVDYASCTDTAIVQITDLSNLNEVAIDRWFWEFSDGTTSEEQNPQIMVTETMSLEVDLSVVSSDGCKYELPTPQIFPIELINLSFMPESMLTCVGEPVELNVDGNSNYQYEWSPANSLDDPTAMNPIASPLSTTTYTVTVTNVNGLDTCAVVRNVVVEVPALPEVEAEGEENSCEETTILTAVPNGDHDIIWSSDPNFNTVIGTDELLVANPDAAGTMYYVLVTDEYDCVDSDSILVYNRQIDVDVNQTAILCAGDTTTLEAFNFNANDELTYEWSPSNDILTGQGTTTIDINPVENTLYNLTVSNQYDCTTEEYIEVEITNLNGEIEIVASVDSIKEGESLELSVAGSNEDYIYEWVPPVYLDDPNAATPTASPTETTNFVVVVQDENGCLGEANIVIIVDPLITTCNEPFVFIPNSFSPNGDGKNDVLYVQGEPIDEITLAIFNRFGQKVFESFDKNMGWDGTYKGNRLDPDVYGFYLEVKCFNGETYFKKGNISLLR